MHPSWHISPEYVFSHPTVTLPPGDTTGAAGQGRLPLNLIRQELATSTQVNQCCVECRLNHYLLVLDICSANAGHETKAVTRTFPLFCISGMADKTNRSTVFGRLLSRGAYMARTAPLRPFSYFTSKSIATSAPPASPLLKNKYPVTGLSVTRMLVSTYADASTPRSCTSAAFARIIQ